MAYQKDKTENLQISVRIRPLSSEESAKDYHRAVDNVDSNMIILHKEISTKLDVLREKRKKEHRFAYDTVFGERTTQHEVYEKTTKHLIPFVLRGFNATVFAYGPTGTGKTYTMVGTQSHPGIMVMALNDLFTLMNKGTEKFKVKMSYLEIYNEHIRDLLSSSSKTLDLLGDPKSNVIEIPGLTSVSTTSTTEVMKLLQKGNQRRKVESTAANHTSSRSHALLQINVILSSYENSDMGEELKSGRLFMVDLAGSERASRTKNVGKTLKEGAHINKSLLALGNVINALAEGGAKFVNFRDSKLTRLLKDALTGNCKTVMIAHVSPADLHREETRNTLIYADKAKMISTKTRQNKLDVSYHISQYQTIIAELKAEIRRLKGKLDEDAADGSLPGEGENGEANEKMDELKKELVETFNEQMELRKKLMEIDNSSVAMSIEFEKQNDVIQEFLNEKKSKKSGGRGSSDASDTEDGSDDDEPEEILEVYEDLVYIKNEQSRYTDMKKAIEEELQEKKVKCKKIEESLPKQTNSYEQREVLTLLCKVHELEIQQVEMASQAILKEQDLYRRDLLLMRFEKQRALCDEIITKQRSLLQDSNAYTHELEEQYALYQLESQYTNNMYNSSSFTDFTLLRSNSVMSLRPDKLPPISNKEPEKLFKPGRKHSLTDDKRPSTPLSISSPIGSKSAEPSQSLPSIHNRNRSFSIASLSSDGSRPWSTESQSSTRQSSANRTSIPSIFKRKKKKKKNRSRRSSVEHLPPLK